MIGVAGRKISCDRIFRYDYVTQDSVKKEYKHVNSSGEAE